MSIASYSTEAPSAQGLLNGKSVAADNESRLAATLRTTHGAADPPSGAAEQRAAASAAATRVAPARARKAAAEIRRAIESRLPGRIRDLKVHVDCDQFALRGVSSSYYVKQVAGHLAMTTMDAHLLGRLVNEIEVRSVR